MDDDFEEDHEAESNFSLEESYKPSRIFEGEWRGEELFDFDAVTIFLDGRVQSDLDWKKERILAQKAMEMGYAILWDIELGLFGQLNRPLSNQSQFLSLTLALEHFRDTLWKEFQGATIGLSVFRGNADFSVGFPWDDLQQANLREWLQEIGFHHASASSDSAVERQLIRLFCRDVAVEYLALLVSRLPDSLAAYLFLDASSVANSPLNQIQLFNPDRFDRLHLALKNHTLPFIALGWRMPTAIGYSGYSSIILPPPQQSVIGVCVPPSQYILPSCFDGLEEAVKALKKDSIPFKLIAESQLTSQWDGLDYLVYTPSGLTVGGKRKLQGFCAAGGCAITTGELLGLPYEVELSDWILTT